MWVQKPQGTEKFAVLFPFHPLDSHTREPLLYCVAITDELAVACDKLSSDAARAHRWRPAGRPGLFLYCA